MVNCDSHDVVLHRRVRSPWVESIITKQASNLLGCMAKVARPRDNFKTRQGLNLLIHFLLLKNEWINNIDLESQGQGSVGNIK